MDTKQGGLFRHRRDALKTDGYEIPLSFSSHAGTKSVMDAKLGWVFRDGYPTVLSVSSQACTKSVTDTKLG